MAPFRKERGFFPDIVRRRFSGLAIVRSVWLLSLHTDESTSCTTSSPSSREPSPRIARN